MSERPVNTAMISRSLKAAGLPKASAYSTWGRKQDGFLVIGPKEYQRQNAAMGRDADLSVHVAFTNRGEIARRHCEKAVATLSAEGYVVTERKNNGLGGTYTIDIIGRNA